MISKTKKRKRETPGRDSAFRMRGKEMKSSDIARYAKRNKVDEDNVETDIGRHGSRRSFNIFDFSRIATPSDLSCYTPPGSINTPPADIETASIRMHTPPHNIRPPSSAIHSPSYVVPCNHLSSFRWFDAYCDYGFRHVRGTPEFQNSPIKNLLAKFIKPVDNYEDQYMYSKMLQVHNASVSCPTSKLWSALLWVETFSMDQQQHKKVEHLLGMIFERLLLHIRDNTYTLPAMVKPVDVSAAVEAFIRGLSLYTLLGKKREARKMLTDLFFAWEPFEMHKMHEKLLAYAQSLQMLGALGTQKVPHPKIIDISQRFKVVSYRF